ncbi:TetR/AcrR family transcriptional regulator [Microbacterium sp. SS28]|uniref:TetR/AcrR family transcriptional regulator n=1 Tax=Microbacterium sp. SS28 TaxID=2919948 RepID=UPI001FAAEA4C|nr:TetR/AcrR family transcriptional regulator [Microbacterium sp. SS28]
MGDTPTIATADRILDLAEELVQTRGVNGMSYADISAGLGITKASLHYHFATKADLVRALIDRYSSRFFAQLHVIEEGETDAAVRLREYAQVYGGVLARGRMCLCGMLASDYETLSPDAQSEVAQFFERNTEWLARVIAEGVRDGELTETAPPRDAAETLLAGLEGAMLVSRPFEGSQRFDTISAALLNALGAAPRPAA